MDTVTYPDQRVADFVERHFVPARVKVKEKPELAKEYLVSWTPNVVITDSSGEVHYRVEGYLEPDEFIGHIALGLGKYHLDREDFAEAARRFDEVAERHRGTNAGAEALYWRGVAEYKQSHDAAQLRPSWQRLAIEFPDSEWTKRTRIPKS
jgi:uncharacterized protein YyaL (SSP411 family)